MLNEALVSIIIPVYNGEKYIEECLHSIIKQDYNHIEVIIIDDGSSDHTAEICKDMCKKDTRLQYFYQNNKGVSSARNLGLCYAHGDYISFVDADDYIKCSYVRILIESIQLFNSEIAIAKCKKFSNMDPIEFEPSKLDCNEVVVQKTNGEEALCRILSFHEYNTAVWGKLYKKDTIIIENKTVMFNEKLTIGEDQLWLIQVIPSCDSVTFVDNDLYMYRQDSASAMHTVNEIKLVDSYNAQLFAIDELADSIDPVKIKALFIRTFIYGCDLAKYYKKHHFSDRKKEIVKTISDYIKYFFFSKLSVKRKIKYFLTYVWLII